MNAKLKKRLKKIEDETVNWLPTWDVVRIIYREAQQRQPPDSDFSSLLSLKFRFIRNLYERCGVTLEED